MRARGLFADYQSEQLDDAKARDAALPIGMELVDTDVLLAVAQPDAAQASLVDLVGMWMLHAGLAPEDAMRRAGPHLDELLRRYPDNRRGQLFSLMRDGERDGTIENARLEAWIRIADPADPLQKGMIDQFKAELAR